MSKGRVVMGLLFFPRGGGAQVVRYLAPALEHAGWDVGLVTGSLGRAGAETHAPTFFTGNPVHALDYTPAVAAFERGQDPMDVPIPIHPSYEDRRGAPDRVLADVEPARLDHLASAWEGPFVAAGGDEATVFHLHHLTPQLEMVTRRWPARPLVVHLHGTELSLLDAIERGAEWPHAGFWRDRLRQWVRHADATVVISPHEGDRAVRLLGVDPERIRLIPNGVDIERFDRRALSVDERLGHLRRWLVEDPRGWDEGGEPGTVRYTQEDLAAFVDPAGAPRTVLIFVGRFLASKRVPLLVRAYARARERFTAPAPLVIWGGHPGESEGEHPHTVAREVGVEHDAFFIGWRGHEDLPLGLACTDAMVAPSVDEPFGQVFLEAMACGLPVVTTASGGPLSFVNTELGAPNGWLVPPDDEAALADALVEVVSDADERRRRGANGYDQVRTRFSWRALAARFDEVYADVRPR